MAPSEQIGEVRLTGPAPARSLVVGEALLDIVRTPDGTTAEHVGGSPANVAMGLARLGRPTDLATCLGEDERGRTIQQHLLDHGVEVTPASIRPGRRTATALAEVDDQGCATYTFDIEWDLEPLELGAVGHLHVGSLGTVLEPGAQVVHEGMLAVRDSATISYDPNVRPGIMGDLAQVRERVETTMALADVVKGSSDDLALLYPGEDPEMVLERWCHLGPALAVVTLGADGVMLRVGGTGEIGEGDAKASEVLDTVGAGDSFMAGLISGLLDAGLLGSAQARDGLRAAGLAEVSSAVARGSACSGLTVGRAGAYAPTLDEL